ncbi:ABC transporter ATP-binding protein [Hoeflea sp. CAU 1731]
MRSTETTPAARPLVRLKNVSKKFTRELDLAARLAQKLGVDINEETVHAVNGINLDIHKGEVVGLVGESGCGKSTLGRVVSGLLPASTGEIEFDGETIDSATSRKRPKDLALRIQMIFQDPYASLNPRMRVGEIISEAPRVHRIVPPNELSAYLDKVMEQCGLDPAYKSRYPHQFSGGQRQRIAIARTLAVKADFIVCDEIVSALDVSIQAQILNLLLDLKQELDLTTLFISHDLGVVEHVSDRVAIMYLGRMVEFAPTEMLFSNPQHPYTRSLLEEVPSLDKRNMNYSAIEGEIPSPFDPPPGCQFHPRCPFATAECRTVAPELQVLESGHTFACHHPQGEIAESQ